MRGCRLDCCYREQRNPRALIAKERALELHIAGFASGLQAQGHFLLNSTAQIISYCRISHELKDIIQHAPFAYFTFLSSDFSSILLISSSTLICLIFFFLGCMHCVGENCEIKWQPNRLIWTMQH